jgi:hypothetical protein
MGLLWYPGAEANARIVSDVPFTTIGALYTGELVDGVDPSTV